MCKSGCADSINVTTTRRVAAAINSQQMGAPLTRTGRRSTSNICPTTGKNQGEHSLSVN